MKDPDRERAARQPRKPYAAPRLRVYGDIRELTRTPVQDKSSGMDKAVGNLKS